MALGRTRVRQPCWRTVMMANSEAKQWFCIRTKIGLESRSSEALSRLSSGLLDSVGDLEVYCPRVPTKRSVAGVPRQILSPLFPGYIFARFCALTASRFVSSRPGIIGLVRFGGQPAVLAERTIEELKATEQDQAGAEALQSFAPGQKLQITDGPFAGMEAEYISSLSGGLRALLLLEYLQRRVSLLVDSTTLEPTVHAT